MMKQTTLGTQLVAAYPRVRGAQKLLRIATQREGGEMFSLTLRQVLERHYGVVVGDFSYGSLLSPGFADSQTTIGRYVSIGPDVRRFGASHPMQSASLHPFWYNPALGFAANEDDVERLPCEIGHDSWIGAGAILLPGCRRVGIGAVVGAGSVVTRDVDDFEVVAGNPARTLRRRFSVQDEGLVRAAAPWLLDPDDAREAVGALRGRLRSPWPRSDPLEKGHRRR